MRYLAISVLMASVAMPALTAAPVAAQENPELEDEARQVRERLRDLRFLETKIAEAEAARLAGDCAKVRSLDKFFQEAVASERFPEVASDLRRRMREVATRDCPPGSGVPSIEPEPSPPVAVPATGSVPDAPQPSLDDLRRAFREACGGEAYEIARKRLLDALDRAVRDASDEETGTRLDRERALVRRTVPTVCPPEESILEEIGETATSSTAETFTPPRPLTVPPSTLSTPPQPRHRLVEQAVQQLEQARAAAAACDRAALTAAINALEMTYVDASANSDWRGTTTRDIHAIGDMEQEARRLRMGCDEEAGISVPVGFGFQASPVLYSFARYGRTGIPSTGIGVRRDGPFGSAPETDAGRSADRIDAFEFGGGLDFGKLRLFASYSDGDVRSLFDREPISGGFNGAVFGAPAPSTSTGIGGGSVALTGDIAVGLSQFRIGGGLEVAQPSPATRVFFTFDYFRDERSYRSSLDGSAGSIQFSQERDQEVVDDNFGVGLEFELETELVTDSGLTFRSRVRLQGFVQDNNLDSSERNTSNFGPPSDQDFAVEIEEDDTSLGLATGLTAELAYALSPRVELFLGGSADYRSEVGGVFNPNSGDQVLDGRTTALITEDSWSYGAQVGLRVALGDQQ